MTTHEENAKRLSSEMLTKYVEIVSRRDEVTVQGGADENKPTLESQSSEAWFCQNSELAR